MKLKRIYLVALILLVLLSVSAVSAADDSANNIISEDNDVIALDEAIDDDESNVDVLGENDNAALNAGETGTFTDLNKLINEDYSSNDTITLSNNYKYSDGDDDFMQGILIGRGVTIDGNGFTLDGSNSARMFNVNTTNEVIIKNINFINGHTTTGYGGAVYFLDQGTVTNCNFTNNSAIHGGAVFLSGTGNVTNCNFTDNSVVYSSGAVRMYSGSVENCTFTNNTAGYNGGAILINKGAVTNCDFVDNSASEGGAIFSYGWYSTADTCIFKTNSDSTNANTFIRPPSLNVDNFTTVYGSGDKLTFDLRTNLTSTPITNGNISISVYFKDGDWIGNYGCLNGEGWIPDLPVGSYYAIFDTEYTEFQPINRTIKIIPNIKFYANVTSAETNNRTVNITAKSNIPQDIVEGKLLFLLPNGDEINATYAGNGTWWAVHTFDDCDQYKVNATYVGLDNVTIYNATITVNKASLELSASAKSFKFEDKTKSYSITLKDKNGNVLKNKKVTLKVNGATYTATTNSKGVATFKLTKLSKKGTYNAVISFAGDKDYNKISKSAKLTVKAPAWKTIAKGSKDKSMVKKIQRALKKNGFYLSYKGRYLKVDGLFHKYTQMAVKQFQKAKKLKVTGKVDYATAKKLKLI